MFVLLKHGSREGKWEKMLDVHESEGGVWKFFLLKSRLVNFVYMEVRIFFIFSSEMWFHTNIGIDSRDLAVGYPQCTCVSPLIY